MEIKKSLFVKYENGSSAWLAPGVEPKDGVIEVQERPMLYPADGKQLVHKETGEISDAIWLKDTVADDYAEIKKIEPKDDENGD